MKIEWDEKWSIGEPLIDSQHKELVKLVNALIFSCDQQSADIPAALSFLVNYTLTHFNDEEALQLEHGFPHYEDHKQKHEELKAIVSEHVANYQKFGSTSYLKNVLDETLAAWLINHIETEDKMIGDFISGNSLGNKKNFHGTNVCFKALKE